jgi:hypothetical protein
MFTQDFREFVELLNKHNAEYLIVGGYAVAIHGYPRYTGDLDIWLNPTKENVAKVLNALSEFGFSSLDIKETDLLKIGNIIQLGYPPVRIDLLTAIDGVDFDDCFNNKVDLEIDDINIKFLGKNDLIKNKQQSGRFRDLDDLRNLQP